LIIILYLLKMLTVVTTTSYLTLDMAKLGMGQS